MQQPPLSTGALLRVASTHCGPDAKAAITGVFQVIECRPMASKDGQQQQNAKPRYKLRLTDGHYALAAMVSSQVAELIMSGALTTGAIVQISDFIINEINNKRMFIAFNCQVLEQYGTYSSPIIIPPFTELVDAQKAADEQSGQAALGQQPQGYGTNNGAYGSAPPPGNSGMYGGPPPPANGGGYKPNQYQQQGPAPGGMYGGPPPPANGGGASGNYGQGGGAYGSGGGAYGGGTNQQQQQQHQPQGMYGGPPPAQQSTPGQGYGGQGGAPQQAGFNPYVPAGVGGGAAGGGGGGGGSRPAPQYQAQGAIARDEAPPRIMPISALNPYTARWAIRARVTSKGELRRWNNVKGEGKVFSFDLLDRDGGEIRATAFGAEADKFFDVIEVGAIYQLSKASLTQKKPQFNHTNHAYEIRLDRNSLLERMPEDQETAQIPTISYNFRRITELETAEAGSMVDVIGVVETCDPWQTITRRTGEETQKRSMVVRDDSGRSVEVTLWGPLVNNPGDQIEQMVRSGARPILAAKALRVGDFNGKTLSTIGASNLRIDPLDLPAAQQLRHWYDSGGRSQAVNSLSNAGMGGGGGGKADRRTTFAAIKDEHLGTSGKPDWITVSAVVDMVKTDASGGGPSAVVYPSCPHDFNGRPCQKKMMDIGGGNWNCERCNYSTDNPAWRYLVSMSACDHTAKQFLTAFGDAGDAIFGRSAAEVRQLEAENSPEFDRMAEGIRFTPFIFRLKVAEDNYNDESRIKVSIYRLERLTDFVKESNLMLQYIKALEAGQPVLTTGGPSGTVAAAASAAAMGAGGSGGQGGYHQQGGQGGGNQYGGPPGNMYGTAPQPTNPYGSTPATNPYGAPPGGGGGGMPRTPPPAGGGGGGGGGMYGGPPAAAGAYNQQGGGGGSGGRGGGGGYGGPPPQQQGGGYGGSGGGYGGGGGGGYGGPGGGGGGGGGGGYNTGGGGGGWNAGPPPPQQQGGGGNGGMYGGPPPPQQNNNAYQVPPQAFW